MARKRSHLGSKIVLIILIAISAISAFWLGLVPQRYSPFSQINIADSNQWFIDLRLSSLRRDRAACGAIIKSPFIAARQIADKPFKSGCGWRNAVRISETGGVRLSAGRITCELATAVSLWAKHVLQPAAKEILGTSVSRIDQIGTYSCRNIIGNSRWRTVRSQHASANAIDIVGFTLANGKKIRLLRHWKSKGPEGKFLREIHKQSCNYFRVALSPNYNLAHKDHFHFDRGILKTCR